MKRWLGSAVVLAHFVVVLLHGSAHTKLKIDLATWQNVFVLIVIVVAPLVAGIIIWTRFSRFGFVLLAAAMGGALVFGAYFHYLAISPDHVSHLPAGDAQGAFRLTALLLAMTEAIGLTIGLVYSRRESRSAALK
jgi:cytochrome bd-type quinol oxidase subunit 2